MVLIDDISFGQLHPLAVQLRRRPLVGLPKMDCDSIVFTPPRFVHQLELLCYQDGITTMSCRLSDGNRDGFPGNLGMRPNDAKYFAETLRYNGYSTAAFGNGMKHQHGKFQYLVHSTDGLLSQALTSSTVLLAVRPINGNP